jgi:hypothetical protein
MQPPLRDKAKIPVARISDINNLFIGEGKLSEEGGETAE